MKLNLYTIIGCKNCMLVKKYLEDHDIPFRVIDCDKNMDQAINVMKLAGSEELPILQYDEENFIIGYKKSNLDKLIKLCKV